MDGVRVFKVACLVSDVMMMKKKMGTFFFVKKREEKRRIGQETSFER